MNVGDYFLKKTDVFRIELSFDQPDFKEKQLEIASNS